MSDVGGWHQDERNVGQFSYSWTGRTPASSAMHDYRKLRVWQEGRQLVRMVYDVTAKFPASEQFGLINQARRAAVTIPSNIAEGSGRSTQIDYARFIDVAVGLRV